MSRSFPSGLTARGITTFRASAVRTICKQLEILPTICQNNLTNPLPENAYEKIVCLFCRALVFCRRRFFPEQIRRLEYYLRRSRNAEKRDLRDALRAADDQYHDLGFEFGDAAESE